MNGNAAADGNATINGSCFSVPTTLGTLAAMALGTLFIYFMQQTFYLAGPRCDLQLLYVPALDLSAPPPPPPPPGNTSNSTNATTNPFLFFELSFENILNYHGILYGDVNLTFSYRHKAVGNYVVPAFYQGAVKTARRRDVVETSGVPWVDAVQAVSSGLEAVFRVEMAARPRFKLLGWVTNPKEIRIAADVDVNGDGVKAAKDEIRLTSLSSSSSSKCGIRVFVAFISGLVATYLLC